MLERIETKDEGIMKAGQWIVAVVLLLLVGGTVTGLFLTRQLPAQTPIPTKGHEHPAAAQSTTPSVDQKPLQTARALAAMGGTQDEQNFARQALKLADYEVDLAFADALRQAAAHPPQTTPELHDLNGRVEKRQAVVKASQDRVNLLTKQLASATDRDKDTLQDQLDVAKAQLELDQDELDDAKEDLTRAGGNPQAKIQELMEEHEAGNHGAPTTPTVGAIAVVNQSDSLWPQIQNWVALHSKLGGLDEARAVTLQDAQTLGLVHENFEKQVQAQEDQKLAVKQQVAGMATGVTPVPSPANSGIKDTVASLHHFSDDQKILSDYDKRIQSQQELADVYLNWGNLVRTQQRNALHGILRSFLWILLIAALVYGARLLLDRYFGDLASDKKGLITLRALTWFGIQAVGVLLAAFTIFGMPSQMPTILGLAGAGLTVALKDFIVGFVGWFVLMGRNGIRVGDWVEINGVGGEVVEIGLLRTTLLETGNWTDSGHPTGRKVSFVNSYAIEGHYFNFSTSGQWLWDEITLSLAGNQNPYPMIESIQKLVEKDTAESTHQAEAEWQHAAARYRVHTFSAAPALNLRPTGSGIELHVRYITRAYERQNTRARLYSAIVSVMHGKESLAAGTGAGAKLA